MIFAPESSSSLFHFTTRENLIGILKNNFKPRWGLEDLSCMIPADETWSHPDGYRYAFPKVCFCDLPLSRAGKHMVMYKKYGIGLTKDWGKKNGLNPVVYVHSQSALSRDIFRTNVVLSKEAAKFDSIGDRLEWEDAMRAHSEKWASSVTINHFTKPYEGDFEHAGENYEGVRFYDEREWRYVPTCDDPAKVYMCFKREWDKLSGPEKESLHTGLPALKFEPDDVTFIIVEHESEILPMVDEILQIPAKQKYTDEKLRLLTTRLISADRIRNDL